MTTQKLANHPARPAKALETGGSAGFGYGREATGKTAAGTAHRARITRREPMMRRERLGCPAWSPSFDHGRERTRT